MDFVKRSQKYDWEEGQGFAGSVRSALGLAACFENGSLSPIDEVQRCLQAAAQAPDVFIFVTSQRALEEAERSAKRWRESRPLSPLDGVPVTWKDLFDVRGIPTTAGSEILRNASPATDDAELVSRASAAGMVCIGKTNLSEFAYSGLGLNDTFGTPIGLSDAKGDHVPGGSSSGAAVAVRRGIGAIGMGTDTAGSIRIPAAFNSLIGYRPSRARYPQTGVFPLARSLDTLGPIALTVADCVAMDGVLLGAAWLARLVLPGIQSCRLIADPDFFEDISEDVRSGCLESLARLKECGVKIEWRCVEALRRTRDLIQQMGWLGAYEALDLHRIRLERPELAQLMDRRVRARLMSAMQMPRENEVRLRAERVHLMAQFAAEVGDATLVLPTVAHCAPLLEPLQQDDALFASTNLDTLRLTMYGSFLDTPSVAMPNPMRTTSMQLMRPSGADETLLSTALAVEHVLY